VFLTLVGFIGVVSCGKFDVAIVSAKEDDDVKKLFSLSFYVLLLIVVLCFIAICIIYIFDLDFYKGEQVHSWFFFIIPSLIYLTGTQVFWMYNVRIKNFKKIAFIRIAETLTNGIVSVILFGMAAVGLLLGALAGQAISFFLLAIIIFKANPVNTFRFDWKVLKGTLKRYKDFPKINIPQGFLDMFQIGALILLISKYYGAEATGYYSLCLRVLQLPMKLIILPISHVFFAEASVLNRNGKSIYPFVKKTIIRTTFLLIAIPIILILFGPWIFSFVYSDKWIEAGVFARILSIWIFFDLIKAPIVQIASILGKQKQLLYFAILNSILFMLAIIIGYKMGFDVFGTLWLVTATQTFNAIIVILYILKISKT
jgi:O-antigen/teichoic acid export membrane protein